MYQEEAICNREIYKNAEINVLKLIFASVVDTGGKFATGVNDTGGKFATGVNDAGGKLPVNLKRP